MNAKKKKVIAKWKKKIGRLKKENKKKFRYCRLGHYSQVERGGDNLTVSVIELYKAPTQKKSYIVCECHLRLEPFLWRCHYYDTEANAVAAFRAGLPNIINPALLDDIPVTSKNAADIALKAIFELPICWFKDHPGYIKTVVSRSEQWVNPWFLAEKGQKVSGDWVPITETGPAIAA